MESWVHRSGDQSRQTHLAQQRPVPAGATAEKGNPKAEMRLADKPQIRPGAAGTLIATIPTYTAPIRALQLWDRDGDFAGRPFPKVRLLPQNSTKVGLAAAVIQIVRKQPVIARPTSSKDRYAQRRFTVSDYSIPDAMLPALR